MLSCHADVCRSIRPSLSLRTCALYIIAFTLATVTVLFTTGFLVPDSQARFHISLNSQQKALAAGKPKFSKVEANVERAAAVKEAFTFAWNGYWSVCKGRDEILPVNGTCRDTRNGWGATAIDALSTAAIMEIAPIVTDILDFVPSIDFSQTSQQVSLFETTIRYLAGLLSGYDLLKGPCSTLISDTAAIDNLLSQSRILADTLKYAFDTPTGIPYNDLNYTTHGTNNDRTNGLATTGSLILEWQRLSDLTGDETYGHLADKAESWLLNPHPESNIPFPGLLGTRIFIEDGNFKDANGGWGASTDSYYEYLIKMYVYDPERYASYRDHWIVAVDSTIKYLASHPASRPDLTFLAAYHNRTLINEGHHLSCFDGGSFLLGGQVLGRRDYVNFGLDLVSGCHATYAATVTGIGPERWSWNASDVPNNQLNFYKKNGFFIKNPSYNLRPEVVESYYYAYRVTGDKMYQDWAWDAFVGINSTCRTDKGFSAVKDVNKKGGGEKLDDQESFMFAEVLKYIYLIHSEDGVFQTNHQGKNQFVYNTEAHPLRVAGRPI